MSTVLDKYAIGSFVCLERASLYLFAYAVYDGKIHFVDVRVKYFVRVLAFSLSRFCETVSVTRLVVNHSELSLAPLFKGAIWQSILEVERDLDLLLVTQVGEVKISCHFNDQLCACAFSSIWLLDQMAEDLERLGVRKFLFASAKEFMNAYSQFSIPD